MFAPSQSDVRRFFCAAYAKHLSGAPASAVQAMEAIAMRWIAEHPEYAAELADAAAAELLVYDGSDGRGNPFLHLSMHLSIEEQCSIDQPPGIRQAVQLLAARRGSAHEAHHAVMECLGEMLWTAERSGRPPDGAAYVDCVRHRATAT